jgi:hypothetical protein
MRDLAPHLGSVATLPALGLAVGLAACGSSGGGDSAPDGIDPRPDAGVQGDSNDDAPIAPRAHVIYPLDRRHSPITPELVEYFASIDGANVVPGAERAFMKVGDSMTRASEFLRCFDGGTVDLADRAGLAPTIDYYMHGDAAGRTPYARVSDAAFNGATGELVLAGSPSPLASELAAFHARLGVVMLGSNDVRRGRSLDAFAGDLWAVADQLLDAGTLPLLSTIPANTGDAWADVQIPRFNLAIRGIAQGLQVPLVDLHRALSPLPNRGIGSDGVHLSIAPMGACVWTTAGLQYGYNTRNLVTVEMLNRVRAALAGVASDDVAEVRLGSGRADDPYRSSWPFADLGDTRTGDAVVDDHGCTNGRAQPGKELVYQLELPAQVRLHAQVIAGGATDVDIHVIAGGTCRGTGDREVIVTVGPGPVTIVVDTPDPASEGRFLIVAGPRVNPPS